MFHDIPSLFLSYALFFFSSFVSAFHSVLYSFGDTFCNRGGRYETPKTVYFKNTANKMELHCVESRRSVVQPSLFFCVCVYMWRKGIIALHVIRLQKKWIVGLRSICMRLT